MNGLCNHLEALRIEPMDDGGCRSCIESGDTWVHLRWCTTCGHIGCCDSSKNKHATKHWMATRHEVVRSREPGEHWAYCYADDVVVRAG